MINEDRIGYLVLIFAIIFAAMIIKRKNEHHLESAERSCFIAMNSYIKGKVQRIYYGHRGNTYIFEEQKWFRNRKSFSPKCQRDIVRGKVEVGDSIYKKEASDTIFIVRNEIKYHFVIGAHL